VCEKDALRETNVAYGVYDSLFSAHPSRIAEETGATTE
jgi:hypothetical protein